MGENFSGRRIPARVATPHINGKEMFALLEVLAEFCRRHPGEIRRAQLYTDVDNRPGEDELKRGRSSNPSIHAMLVKRFGLQVTESFWLSLRWVQTED